MAPPSNADAHASSVHLLDVPFAMRGVAQASGARWDAGLKATIWIGDALPPALRAFQARPYSLERWRQDEARGLAEPSPAGAPGWAGPPMRLREHQEAGRRAIARNHQEGRAGAGLFDETGVGKSLTALAAAFDTDPDSILIVCPMHAIAHWRETVARYGDRGVRVVIINYDRLSKIVEAPLHVPQGQGSGARRRGRKAKPKRIRTAKGKARYGTATAFSVAVFDEAHKLRNLNSARSKFAAKIAAAAEFTIYVSATAGQNPLELSYLANLLCEQTGERPSDLKEWEAWCQGAGFNVKRGAYGKWSWAQDEEGEPLEAERAADLERMHALLFCGEVPLGIRRTPQDIAGWPAVQRVAMPIALSPEDTVAYNQAWDDFRREHGLARAAKAATGPRASGQANPLVAQLRFRQKASLLRTQSVLEAGLDHLETGAALAVSVQFIETLEILKAGFEAAGKRVATIDGSMDELEREENRLSFQHGRSDVVVFTVTDAISLHEDQYGTDGRKRIAIVADPYWSAIQMKQVEGRTHRDGRSSIVYWAFAQGGVEERIAHVVSARMRDMGKMKGDEALEREIADLVETFVAA